MESRIGHYDDSYLGVGYVSGVWNLGLGLGLGLVIGIRFEERNSGWRIGIGVMIDDCNGDFYLGFETVEMNYLMVVWLLD